MNEPATPPPSSTFAHLEPDRAIAVASLRALAFEFLHEAETTTDLATMHPPELPLSPTPLPFRPTKRPRRTDHHDPVFTLTVHARVMAILYQQLTAGGADGVHWVTRRDVFYRDPALFGTQRAVDYAVHAIAATVFGEDDDDEEEGEGGCGILDTAPLGVIAGARGVVLGPVLLHLHDAATPLDARAGGPQGVHIPAGAHIARVELAPHVRWVVVVEKEAVFHTLAGTRLPRHAVLVTSRGFPDVATRQFLARVPAQVGIAVLVDGDPFGVHIFAERSLQAMVRLGHKAEIQALGHAGLFALVERAVGFRIGGGGDSQDSDGGHE
ncbi:endodeoxyribonuclease [Blastocladiella emersonii ATCC 22665]|nr:endodeoxyribonuclease [Blastocladiella emersonii ATCC 22665]